MNSIKKSSAFSNMSIETRLPLLIFILLFIVIFSLALTSYVGVRNASMEVGHERLKALTDQFAGLFRNSTQAAENLNLRIASSPDLRTLITTGKVTNPQSASFNILSDTLTVAAEVWNTASSRIYTSDSNFVPPGDVAYLFDSSLTKNDRSITGRIYSRGDTLFYPLITAVIKKDSSLLGYYIRWRRIYNTKQAVEQITGLLGENAYLYVGNSDGSLWTNLLVPFGSLPVDPDMYGIQEYKNINNQEVLASVAAIPGTSWIFLIELSKASLMETADKFLQYLIIIGAVMLLLGFVLAWIMSRNITKPLNSLTNAAVNLSAGNFNTPVLVNRGDELGKLANSFNKMIDKVRQSQSELEQKVEDRTSQLMAANEELEEVNIKLKQIDEIKTNFFTNVSHELRTPLTLILGPIEKLLNGSVDRSHQNDLRIIQQNARILLKHVNNLLDLAKLEVGKLEINYANINFSSMVRIIASYFDSLASEQNIKLKIFSPDDLLLQADPQKLERILMNLFSNAFKFTPVNGVIECKLYEENGCSVFEIHDSGPGIDPLLLNNIFDRFQKENKGLNRNLGSTGLGLSIVKEFVELHKGSIQASNSPEGGAVFKFLLPLQAPHGLQVQPNDGQYSISDNTMQMELARKDFNPVKPKHDVILSPELPLILIVEDNVEMNGFIAEILQKDYNIIQAFNGREGLEKASSNRPDLIISDVMMPEMSGDEFFRRLASDTNLSSIPVILLTAKADETLRIELLKLGAHDYLNKPFTIEELKARINNVIKLKVAKDLLQKELESRTDDIISLINEITQKKKIIENSLNEKNILLKELHHRVKNNLQIIVSLLNLQCRTLNDNDSIKALKESQDRIRSMALIHERLYKFESFAYIGIKDYIHELTKYLFDSYKLNSDRITSRIDVEDVTINIDVAVSLGLIINELITNSLKYAFRKTSAGEISVSLKKTNYNNSFLLIVKDTGEGLPEGFDVENTESLGLLLVNTLVEQINGNIKINNNSGTEVIIDFAAPDTPAAEIEI